MLSAVLFLVAACAKTSYGHSEAVSTRDSKINASNSNEYSTIPEDFDSKRRLRGAVNRINRIKERDAAIEEAILQWDTTEMVMNKVNELLKSHPQVKPNFLATLPESYEKMMDFKNSLQNEAATNAVSFKTMNLLGVRPQELKNRIGSKTIKKIKGKVDRYKDYLNKAFYFPEGRLESPGTSRIEENSDGLAFSNLYSRKVLEVLATAIINIDNVEKLASLASGPVYRRALELLPKYKAMMSKYPVEQWPQEDIILQRLLDVHKT